MFATARKEIESEGSSSLPISLPNKQGGDASRWLAASRTMLPRFRRLVRQIMARTPFEIRRRLPAITLAPLDLVLASFGARGKEMTILQVGACDGTYNDPIRHHVIKGCTRAILVEPNPLAFARLQKSYVGLPNVTLIQTAIGEQDGEANLYRVKKTDKAESENDLTLQFASFYRAHLERLGKKPDEIERITVPCRSLSSLVAELGLTKVDLLQVDAEGFDAAVVRMALRMTIPPDCINFEHAHLRDNDRQPLFDLLQDSGYVVVYDAWNILAMQTPLLEELKA
jgi:FkbM family methyltransferase